MALKFVNCDFELAYGIVAEKEPLPDGWKYHECSSGWLMAEDPDGKMWLTSGKSKDGKMIMTEAVPQTFSWVVKSWAVGSIKLALEISK